MTTTNDDFLLAIALPTVLIVLPCGFVFSFQDVANTWSFGKYLISSTRKRRKKKLGHSVRCKYCSNFQFNRGAHACVSVKMLVFLVMVRPMVDCDYTKRRMDRNFNIFNPLI